MLTRCKKSRPVVPPRIFSRKHSTENLVEADGPAMDVYISDMYYQDREFLCIALLDYKGAHDVPDSLNLHLRFAIHDIDSGDR